MSTCSTADHDLAHFTIEQVARESSAYRRVLRAGEHAQPVVVTP